MILTVEANTVRERIDQQNINHKETREGKKFTWDMKDYTFR